MNKQLLQILLWDEFCWKPGANKSNSIDVLNIPTQLPEKGLHVASASVLIFSVIPTPWSSGKSNGILPSSETSDILTLTFYVQRAAGVQNYIQVALYKLFATRVFNTCCIVDRLIILAALRFLRTTHIAKVLIPPRRQRNERALLGSTRL